MSSSPAASALQRWTEAYAYLTKQTKPTEIVCTWVKPGGKAVVPDPRPTRFYNFADAAAWKNHIVTRQDPLPTQTFEECSATVPTTVPYGPGIETFLSRYGLTFGPAGATGLTPIEIAYAGQNAADPDIVYHDKPGLFGLSLALTPLGQAAFETGTSRIVQPADEATARRYLRYAKPLLDWYGHIADANPAAITRGNARAQCAAASSSGTPLRVEHVDVARLSRVRTWVTRDREIKWQTFSADLAHASLAEQVAVCVVSHADGSLLSLPGSSEKARSAVIIVSPTGTTTYAAGGTADMVDFVSGLHRQ